jgi:hypothetical protein
MALGDLFSLPGDRWTDDPTRGPAKRLKKRADGTFAEGVYVEELETLNTAIGAPADPAVVGDAPGTLKSAIRGIGKIFADVWNAALHMLMIGDAPMNSIVDSTTTPGYIYQCEAPPGTATNAAAWRISRTSTSGVMIRTWAGGDGQFDKVADNRAALNYS